MRRLPRERAEKLNSNACPRCGRVHDRSDSSSCLEHERREARREERIDREAREIRKEIVHKEHRGEKCRCPFCGHDFVWPPEPCPRCGRVHEQRPPWVSPGACEDDIEYPINPKKKKEEGGFSKLFGGGSMLNILMLMMLFGGGMGGSGEINKLFMHPMFQLLEKMGGLSGGGSMMDALGPLLGGGDMGALGSILANLGKEDAHED